MYEPYIMYNLKKMPNFLEKQALGYLKDIYGVGPYRSRRFLILAGLSKDFNCKVKLLKYEFFRRSQYLSFRRGYSLGAYLRKRRSLVRKFLQAIKLRRGLRQFYGLPSRGQRSHTNASSAKKNKSYIKVRNVKSKTFGKDKRKERKGKDLKKKKRKRLK
jgi:small subunit ribosomal protein S13